MITHRPLGPYFVARGQRHKQGFVLGQRFFGDPRLEHQAEDMEMRVQVLERAADQLIAGDLHDLIVQFCVKARESGIAQSRPGAIQSPHLFGGICQLEHVPFIHALRGATGSIRLQQETKLVEFFKAPPGDLRGRAVTDQMRFDDQTFAFQPSQRFANRRVRDLEFADQSVNHDARAGCNLQRHELIENRLINVIDQALMPLNSHGTPVNAR